MSKPPSECDRNIFGYRYIRNRTAYCLCKQVKIIRSVREPECARIQNPRSARFDVRV